MLNKYTVQLMALGIVGSFAATAVAEDSALIDALVKKGVLKTKEAEQIRAEAAKSKNSSAGKLDLDASVKSLSLSGDFRVRYNYTSGTGIDPTNGGVRAGLANGDDKTAQQSFYDMRLRINADYKLSDDFYAGFGVRTQRDARNDNALMANGNAGTGDFGIGIYRAFLGWHPVEGVELVAGAQKNPFYTTDLVWDSDINPAGFSQKIDLNKTLGVSGIDLSLVSGQFIIQDNSENNPALKGAYQNRNRDAFLWQTQLVAGIDLGAARLTVAPGYLASNGGLVGPLDDDHGDPVVSSETNNVQVLLIPGDVTGEVAGIKAKFLWDFAYNFEGRDRSGLGTASKGTDRLAWLIGARLGENKKQGDFSVLANYRQTGQGALPQNLSDNEIGFYDSRNIGALKVGASYSLSDSSYFGLNYLRFSRVNEKAGNALQNGEWLQAEVGVKF